jgi:hypothetical protein
VIVISIEYDAKFRKLLKEYGIKKHRLENCLSFLANHHKRTTKIWFYTLSISVVPGPVSGYIWGTNEIQIGDEFYGARVFRTKRQFVIQTIVHEFKHWIQCNIDRAPVRDVVDYVPDSNDDIDHDKYANNKYEHECKEWEKIASRLDDFF